MLVGARDGEVSGQSGGEPKPAYVALKTRYSPRSCGVDVIGTRQWRERQIKARVTYMRVACELVKWEKWGLLGSLNQEESMRKRTFGRCAAYSLSNASCMLFISSSHMKTPIWAIFDLPVNATRSLMGWEILTPLRCWGSSTQNISISAYWKSEQETFS